MLLQNDDHIVTQTMSLAIKIETLYKDIQTKIHIGIGHCILVFPEFCIKCVSNRDGLMIHCPPLKKINNFSFNEIEAINFIQQCINTNQQFDNKYYNNFLV
jgi:hypothetical protein